MFEQPGRSYVTLAQEWEQMKRTVGRAKKKKRYYKVYKLSHISSQYQVLSADNIGKHVDCLGFKPFRWIFSKLQGTML